MNIEAAVNYSVSFDRIHLCAQFSCIAGSNSGGRDSLGGNAKHHSVCRGKEEFCLGCVESVSSRTGV